MTIYNNTVKADDYWNMVRANIKSIIKEKNERGINQRTVADRIGISESQLSNYLAFKGTRQRPIAKILTEVAQVLEVSIETITGKKYSDARETEWRELYYEIKESGGDYDQIVKVVRALLTPTPRDKIPLPKRRGSSAV